ncbi:P-loop containing nucleoside triphosphate hydrolase protein [Syncephalastrum racemosum]|uniref:P-loop containing nucleoside triphosphate hydrolase protein n=1 Tax=Syncephalastrum racemosum TaxID=13706 RepID=A0A1X2HAH0_SYNRA|nr:P-loop containing nucleoside triphosphate hydrolase protein [Syncephalastrum racemosum]
MAPLQVIGAGFGRTGTDSLRTALNMLGYRCHHMKEMMVPGRYPLEFRDAYLHPEKETDWDMIYDDFDAAVDWPSTSFLKQLMDKYPEAKIILTERDAESWYKSIYNTIYQFPKNNLVTDDAPQEMKDMMKMCKTIVLDGAFGDKPGLMEDKEKIMAMILEHNAWCKANIPAERLLVLQTAEMSWETLCPFLGKDIPNVPFPRANSSGDMNSLGATIAKNGWNEESVKLINSQAAFPRNK